MSRNHSDTTWLIRYTSAPETRAVGKHRLAVLDPPHGNRGIRRWCLGPRVVDREIRQESMPRRVAQRKDVPLRPWAVALGSYRSLEASSASGLMSEYRCEVHGLLRGPYPLLRPVLPCQLPTWKTKDRERMSRASGGSWRHGSGFPFWATNAAARRSAKHPVRQDNKAGRQGRRSLSLSWSLVPPGWPAERRAGSRAPEPRRRPWRTP